MLGLVQEKPAPALRIQFPAEIWSFSPMTSGCCALKARLEAYVLLQTVKASETQSSNGGLAPLHVKQSQPIDEPH
jgi:hypothetical protein